MTASKPSPVDPSGLMATSLAYPALWSAAMGEAMQAWLYAWSTIVKSYGEAGEACAGLFQQTLDLEQAEARALADGADGALEGELHALEDATQHLVYGAEEILAGVSGPLVPLPE